MPSLPGVRVVKQGDEPPEDSRPSRRHSSTRLPSGFTTLRDLVSFVAGMAVLGNEVFLSATVEPYAVGVGIALTGLPLVLGADERKAR